MVMTSGLTMPLQCTYNNNKLNVFEIDKVPITYYHDDLTKFKYF